VFDTLGRRDDPGINYLSRRILSDSFTPFFDETLHGGAGVSRKAFAQFFSHLLQAFKMSLGLFKVPGRETLGASKKLINLARISGSKNFFAQAKAARMRVPQM
jgi:hypothetical protein